jgi:hypothetical protein
MTAGNSGIRSYERRQSSDLKYLQRGEIPKISHPLLSVETAGIEPASAVA